MAPTTSALRKYSEDEVQDFDRMCLFPTGIELSIGNHQPVPSNPAKDLLNETSKQ